MEGTNFGNAPLSAAVQLEAWPHSAGVVIGAIRCCAIAFDRGLAGRCRDRRRTA